MPETMSYSGEGSITITIKSFMLKVLKKITGVTFGEGQAEARERQTDVHILSRDCLENGLSGGSQIWLHIKSIWEL